MDAVVALLAADPELTSDKTPGLMLHWKPFNSPNVEELERLVASGAGKPAIDRSFRLDQVVAALSHVHEGHARGKVLIHAGGRLP